MGMGSVGKLFGSSCDDNNDLDTTFRGVMNCYFKNGNRIKSVVYDNTGKVIDKYEYSDSLLLKKKFCNFNEDTVYNTRTFQYDSKGNLIRDPVKYYSLMTIVIVLFVLFSK